MVVLPVTTPYGSSLRLFFAGPVGVAGVNVQQSWDLSSMPHSIREDPTFRDNWRIFVRQVDTGVSDVRPMPDFLPATGAPDQILLTLTSSDPADSIEIEFWYIHSVVR